MSRRRVAIWLAMLAAVLVSCAVLATAASAGTYSVYSCSGPSGETLPNYTWLQRLSVPSHTAAFTFGSTCPDLSVTATPGTTLALGEDAGYAFSAPAGTTISGYDVRRSITIAFPTSGTKPVLSAGLRRTTSSGESYLLECEAKIVNCSIATSGTQAVGISATSLQLGVECAQAASCAGNGFTTLRTALVSSRIDLTDNHSPTLSVTGGTLPGASGSSGVKTLDVAVGDVGGGVKRYALAIDGVQKAATNLVGSCATVITQPVPCPGTVAPSFSIDLASYASGTHSAVVTATDVAGNVGSLAPVSFTVPGGASGGGSGGTGVGANGTPAVDTPILATRKRVLDGKAGRAVSVRGVLKTSAGAPIVGATLEVTASSLGVSSAGTSSLGTTKSAKDGSFAFKVKPKGARQVTFSFRPGGGAASTATATTIVRQILSLTARRSKAVLTRGNALTISGRLSGTAGAAAGAAVDIQVLNGKKWAKVASVVASKSGSYKWKYRFKRVTRPTLFRFRAVVRAKASWPWPSKSSTPIQVLVRG